MSINLSPEDKSEIFGDYDPAQYDDEAQLRWGQSEAYTESKRRTSSYSKQDWLRIQDEAEGIEREFLAAMTAGVSSDDPLAKSLAEKHRLHIDRYFYPCSFEMHTGLAQMYVSDPRFTTHYDKHGAGLAVYIHEAIIANALDHS